MDPGDINILVVEDDEFTRLATVEILRSCLYKVQSVEHGKEALDILEKNEGKIDLVLCDVMLPVMNGIQLLESIKNSEKMAHIPVVMTSSNEEMEVVTSCLSKGAKDYLIKPIQVNTAKTLLRHVWLCRKEVSYDHKLWRNFEVIRTLGKGTHGIVVLARRKSDQAVVALKKVRMSLISENAQNQARNEVILLKSLYHVNIARFYDSFMVEDELNIVMEYADGGNMRQLVRKKARENQGYFPESQVMSWFAQLVLAVAYIHGKNVLHRDLKSQNIFLTSSNVIKLGDFGISRALSGDVLANTTCGTPESMSPEICRGEPYGKKSDIWALGCVLYEILMLRRPFDANTIPAIFEKICKGEFIPVHDAYSRDLRLLVIMMLQQDPAKRPTIEDIYRFPFVQKPIQDFLTEHVSEFQEALELEAKLHQSQNAFSKQANEMSSSDLSDSTLSRTNSIRDTAMAAAVVGLSVDDSKPGMSVSLDPISIQLNWKDEIAKILHSKVHVCDRKAGFFTTYQACVTGSELVDTLKKLGKTHDDAIDIIGQLIDSRILNIVASDHTNSDLDGVRTYLRFQVDELNQPLNLRYIWHEEAHSATEVSSSIRELSEKLHELPNFPDNLKSHELYENFQRSVSELQNVDISCMPKPDRQAFFINVYNAMVIQGLIEFGMPQSTDSYKLFEKNCFYSIGKHNYSLCDIRHGILRGNRKPPSQFWGKQFEPNDPRMKYILHIRDPRCLLALIDYSPPLFPADQFKILRPGSTDTLLEEVAQRFCQTRIVVSIDNEEVCLPKLFRLYRDDFGANEYDLLNWIGQYLDECPPRFSRFRVRYNSSIAV